LSVRRRQPAVVKRHRTRLRVCDSRGRLWPKGRIKRRRDVRPRRLSVV